jgi:hypothetical protein
MGVSGQLHAPGLVGLKDGLDTEEDIRFLLPRNRTPVVQPIARLHSKLSRVVR